MEMQHKVCFLLISLILLSGTTLATSLTLKSAAQPYYIDPQHNLWLKVDMNGSTQHFNVHNTLGYSPNGDAVMWAYDNFSIGNLNTSKWTAYQKGSNNSTVEVQNGHLVLSGSGNISSANVVLNKPFTNGIELAVNETLTGGTHNLGTFSDVSFGSGAPVGGIRGTDWWHTHFKAGGGSFQSQGIDKAMIWVNSNNSDITVPTPGVRLSDYVQENISHTVAYSYDSSGNANMYMLNVTQNRLPLSISDPYGYNQFNHPSIYFNEIGVFGHKWWMFITPYAYSRGELENACLYYSDDGLVWHVPPGVKNPIGTPIESEYESNAYGLDPYGSDPYDSDSHIIYNPNIWKFMCYYVIEDVVGDDSSCPIHTDTLLYRSAGVFSDEENILKLWISAQDNNGVWTVFYTQATKERGIWKVGTFITPRAPLMTTKNTQYLYTPKQWMISQGDSPKSHGVKREISEVWGYKTGHTPRINVKNMGTYTQINVNPIDLHNVSDYQVMIPASMLNISSHRGSLDVEHA